MSRVLDDGLIYQVLSVVDEIPTGRVATYGQIARLIGRERNAAGRLAPGWPEQADLLLAEGVPLKANGCVDLALYRWDC